MLKEINCNIFISALSLLIIAIAFGIIYAIIIEIQGDIKEKNGNNSKCECGYNDCKCRFPCTCTYCKAHNKQNKGKKRGKEK